MTGYVIERDGENVGYTTDRELAAHIHGHKIKSEETRSDYDREYTIAGRHEFRLKQPNPRRDYDPGECVWCDADYSWLPAPLARRAEKMHSVRRHRKQVELHDREPGHRAQITLDDDREWRCSECETWNHVYRNTPNHVTCPECSTRFGKPVDVEVRPRGEETDGRV